MRGAPDLVAACARLHRYETRGAGLGRDVARLADDALQVVGQVRDDFVHLGELERLAAPYRGAKIDAVIGIESRGFILGGAVAQAIGAGFIPVRLRITVAALVSSLAMKAALGGGAVGLWFWFLWRND